VNPLDISPLTRVVTRVDRLRDGEVDASIIPTGFPSLDRAIGGGFHRGDLIVLGGDDGVGCSSLALAIALKLTRDETDNLLARAGYALSPARTMDIIIAHFLDVGNYNIDDINAVLFSHEQGTLGV